MESQKDLAIMFMFRFVNIWKLNKNEHGCASRYCIDFKTLTSNSSFSSNMNKSRSSLITENWTGK